MSEFWGEIPTKDESILSKADRETVVLAKPLDIEAPPLQQPSLRHFPPSNESLEAEAFQLDPLTLHTIQLVQYARRLRTLIQQVRLQLHELKANEGEAKPTFPPTPPMPEYEGPPLKHQASTPLPFIHKDLNSDFARGFGKAPPEIDSKSNRKLLRKSVAAVCAHAGYDTCNESTLETLTDITHDYMQQMTHLLRRAVDEEAETGDAGFADPMERVFHEMGLGDTTVVHNFYQSRVINYHNFMIDRCHNLRRDYDRMKNPDFTFDDPNFLRNKDEPAGDSSIHFPATDEADESVENDSLQLDGLALDMSGVSQESSSTTLPEDDSKWPHSVKSEHSDTRVGGLDSFDEAHSVGSTIAHTPAMSSEAGESIQDPASVSASDLMSPPPSLPPSRSSVATGGKPPKKKRKR